MGRAGGPGSLPDFGAVDVVGVARLPFPPARVFAEVADLGGYPDWLSLVRAAAPAPAAPGDPGPAWLVDLGARVGPFSRTKRVRMARAEMRPPTAARFERAELDDRPHSPWVLAADVDAEDDGATTLLRMHLHYGGAAWLPGLEAVLRQEIRRASGRLAARLAE